jgi:O-methyltransferase
MSKNRDSFIEKFRGKFELLGFGVFKFLFFKSIALLADEFRLLGFIFSRVGRGYGLTSLDRFLLTRKLRRIDKGLRSGSNRMYFLVMVKEILSLDPNLAGDLIECGSYYGKSTCFFSLLAGLIGRKLWVCDSFRGLPKEENMTYTAKYQGYKVEYHEGGFSSGLDNVKSNLAKFGNLDVCNFVAGYFRDSLPALANNKYVFAYIDVDLLSSTKDCLLHVYPRLQEGCRIYNDDMNVLEIEKIYFNDDWWRENFNIDAPGARAERFYSMGYLLKVKTDSYPIYQGGGN